MLLPCPHAAALTEGIILVKLNSAQHIENNDLAENDQEVPLPSEQAGTAEEIEDAAGEPKPCKRARKYTSTATASALAMVNSLDAYKEERKVAEAEK